MMAVIGKYALRKKLDETQDKVVVSCFDFQMVEIVQVPQGRR